MAWSPVLHADHYNELLTWAKHPAPRTPCVVFLYGPPGVGKTTLAHRVLTDANLRAVECNASQFRHKAAMSDIIEPLLKSGNVTDYFTPGGHRALGVILDEIDGMTAGDKGGLSELVRILKDYRGPNAVICISNEWNESRYKPLIRISQCRYIGPPDVASCATWIGCDPEILASIWSFHQGDLRKLRQWQENPGAGQELLPIQRKLTVEKLVLRLLSGPDKFAIEGEHILDNNDMNLAGLHLHESLPAWIRVHYGSDERAYQIYSDCLQTIAISDRQDYYTFFYQHWSLFPHSFQSKLEAVHNRLFLMEHPAEIIPPSAKGWKFEYTSVLSKQSWLFNQFKYLCELRDRLKEVPAYRFGGIETARRVASYLHSMNSDGSQLAADGPWIPKGKPAVTNERVQTWIRKLIIPTVPPCPFAKI